MLRDFLRWACRWLWPAHDPDALAAFDGGPGPEPRRVTADDVSAAADELAFAPAVIASHPYRPRARHAA